MNESKRKNIQKALGILKDVRMDLLSDGDATVIEQSLEKASDILDSVRDEESDSMDNMPESLQTSDRYYKMEEAVQDLEDAVSHIGYAVHELKDTEEAVSYVQRAIEFAVSATR